MMSRDKLSIEKKEAIIRRFIEVCGSDEPAHIKQLLNISYQAARNYLKDKRVPKTEILLAVAENTPYSIHWLLTGEGNKYVGDAPPADTPILTDQTRESLREISVEVFNEQFEKRRAEFIETQREDGSKVVVLPPGKLRSERAVESTDALPEKKVSEPAPTKPPLT